MRARSHGPVIVAQGTIVYRKAEAEIQEDGRARFLFPRETGIDLVGMSAVIAHGTY